MPHAFRHSGPPACTPALVGRGREAHGGPLPVAALGIISPIPARVPDPSIPQPSFCSVLLQAPSSLLHLIVPDPPCLPGPAPEPG